MLAYHNDPSIKQEILEQLQRPGWNVSIEDYKTRLGIPMVLVHLQDAIFKGLPEGDAKNWPIRFFSAINVGADLSIIWREFAIWLLVDPTDGVVKYTIPGSDADEAILMVAHYLYQHDHTEQQMRDAATQAYRAFNNATAYAAAAHTTYVDAAAFAAYTAAATATVHAAHAVHAANIATATHAAVYTAYAAATKAARDATDAYDAARNAFYTKMANKLIDLLKKKR